MKTANIIKRLESQGYRVTAPPEWFQKLKDFEQEVLVSVGLGPYDSDVFFMLNRLNDTGRLNESLKKSLIDAGVMLD